MFNTQTKGACWGVGAGVVTVSLQQPHLHLLHVGLRVEKLCFVAPCWLQVCWENVDVQINNADLLFSRRFSSQSQKP